MLKICRKCGLEKSINDFPIRKCSPDGYDPWCKECRNRTNREYRETHQQQFKAMRQRHYQRNIEKMRAEKIAYGKKHKEQKAEYDRKYRQENKPRLRAQIREWERNSLENRLRRNLRRRIAHVLRGETKSESSFALIGCTLGELKTHLENLFLPGMTWENYGHFGWHIDHIVPCCSFDLSKPEEQRQCFHYTNLQPLWWRDNLTKAAKMPNQ